MYFIGLTGSIWTSQDSGATYKKLQDAPLDIEEIFPHPKIPSLCVAQSAKALYLVERNGDKWTKLATVTASAEFHWNQFAGVNAQVNSHHCRLILNLLSENLSSKQQPFVLL